MILPPTKTSYTHRLLKVHPKDDCHEPLAKGLPFLVVNPIRGQEERNADHLLEEGAGIRCNNLPVLAYKVDKLLNDPKRLARMRANARRLSRPQAAFDIVRKLDFCHF